MADSTGLQMPNGLQMPAIPNVPGSTGSAAPTTTGGMTTTPAVTSTYNPATGQGGLQMPAGYSASTPQTQPTAFQTQAIPNVTLHPNIVTPSGATVNPSTGGLVSPAGGPAIPVTSSMPSGATSQFYKPGPNDAGYDPANPQAVYDSTGKILNYTDYINAGGKSDFSNVTPGAVPLNSGAPTSPAAPAAPAAATTPATPDLSTYAGALAKLEADTSAAPPETSPVANELNNLESGLGITQAATANTPIPMEFITGQQQAEQARETALAAPLTQQLAQLQAQRTATLAADEAAVTGLKPVSTTLGSTLTSPTTGDQLGGFGSSTGAGTATDATGGATDAQILGYLQANGLSGTKANMIGLISAVRQGYSAQDLISGKANVAGATAGAAAAASNKSQFMIDGNGNLVQVTPTVAGAGTGSPVTPSGTGAFSAKAPTAAAAPAATAPAGTKFTLAADGVTVLANGTPIDLATFKQMTGQTNVADNKVNFSAVQKPAAPKTTSTTAPAAGPSSTTGLSGAANQYFLSGDISKTGLHSSASIDALNTQVQNYAKSLGIDNWSAAKVAALNAGDAANYAQQIQYLTTTQRSVSNAENGFKQVLAQFPGINNVQSPLWNKTANELAQTLTGGQRTAFEAGLTEIANEYSQVFSRGGANTVSAHTSASDIVNGNLSMKDLQNVLTELQAQGNVVVSGAKTALNGILSGFGTGNTPNANGHTTGQTVVGGDGKTYTIGADGNYYLAQ